MSELEKNICDYILLKKLKERNCKILSIRQYYEVNKIIDFILRIKKRKCFIIKLEREDKEIEEYFAIVKEHHDEVGPEYIILNNHWENHYKNNHKYRIPRPFGWIPEHKILIIEKVEGSLLSKTLNLLLLPGINIFSKNYIQDTLALSIDWLIDFQKYTLSSELFDFKKLFTLAREKTKQLDKEWKKLGEVLLDKIDYNIIASLSIPQVDWHGDFLHRNIIIKKSKITVIDWEGHWKFDSLHPLFEVYRFIFSLLLIKRRKFYSFEKVKQLAHWSLSYYMDHSFLNISYDCYKSIYYLFLIEMIYNYDKQVKGLSILKSENHSELIKKILEIKFEDIFYD